MEEKKKILIELNEIDDTMRMVELQRELVIRLTHIKERTAQNNEEMKKTLLVAQAISNLKGKLHLKGKRLMTLDEEIRKEINKQLFKRHLNWSYKI